MFQISPSNPAYTHNTDVLLHTYWQSIQIENLYSIGLTI